MSVCSRDWPFANWYVNSLIVAIITTIAVLFFSSLAGFGFAKYRFRGNRVLFFVVLGSTMIPFQLILVPLFIVMSRIIVDKYILCTHYTFHGSGCFNLPHAAIYHINSI